MTSRQSTTAPRAGATTTATRKSSATPTSIPATAAAAAAAAAAAVSKHNTRRKSRDACGEKKRSGATASSAAAAHGEAVATATAVGAKPQSRTVVRSSRGRSGSRSGDLGPNSRPPSVREGVSSAASSADTAYPPPVGPRQGASLPLGTAWSPPTRPAPAGGGCAPGNGNSSSAKRTGRVQHSQSSPMGNPDMTQQDQGNGATAKGGAGRVTQSQAGQGGGRVVRGGVNGKSALSPRTPAARAPPGTVQGSKRKRKGAPSSGGAEAASTAAVAAAAAAAASPVTQPAAANPPHPTASSTSAQPRVAEKGFPLQLKQAGPGGKQAAEERFDKFPRMLQDKEKCALLRAIERCPEPDNVASFITKGKAKYEFWSENILTPVVNDLEGDSEYRGNARELFGSIRYFTAIYNWVRNQKKQLGDFYSDPGRSGKDAFDFSGQTALMEARRRAFKNTLPTIIGGGKEAAGKGKRGPGKGKEASSGKGNEASGNAKEISSRKSKEDSGNGNEGSGKGKGKGKRKVAAAAAATATAAAAVPASSPPQAPKTLSGNPAETAGSDQSLVRKGKSRHRGSKDWRVPIPGTEGGEAVVRSLMNGTDDDSGGSGSGNVDGGGGRGEGRDDAAPFFSEDAYEKAKGAALASTLSAPAMYDPTPPNPENRSGDKERNPSSKKRNRGGSANKTVRQEAGCSTTFEKRVAEDLAKLAEAVQGGVGGAASSGTTAVPVVPNALDIAAQRLKTAQFLWQLKKEGCQSVEVDDKTIWELALKSADI